MRTRMLAVMVCALGAVACGDDGGDTGGGATQEPETVSMEITAAEGGEIEVSGATLAIEGGALGEDVTIEVESSKPDDSLPDFDSITGLVYDFGPDGTTFDPAARLELPLDGKVPEGKQAVVSWLDGDAWVDLETEVSGGVVSADVEHFTMFVVRMRNVDASEIDCGFEACGGELEGDWEIIGACANTDDADGESTDGNPFESCGGTLEIILDGEGNASFNGDGTFSALIDVTPTMRYTLPAACVEMFGTSVTSCEDVATMLADEGEATCTGDVETECVCDGVEPDTTEPINAMGTWETSGNQLTTTTDGTANPTEYCVEGNKAKVVFSNAILIFQAK